MNNIGPPGVVFESKASERWGSSVFQASRRSTQEPLYVKRITKACISPSLLTRQLSLFKWLSYFGVINVQQLHESEEYAYVEWQRMPNLEPFDLLCDDCTVSEKTAIGLLWVLLNVMNGGRHIFTPSEPGKPIHEMRSLAASIYALLAGISTRPVVPGEPLANAKDCDTIGSEIRISQPLTSVLTAMLCEDDLQSPTPAQCLQAPLFKLCRSECAIESLCKKIIPIHNAP
jgi:hypothetical protein